MVFPGQHHTLTSGSLPLFARGPLICTEMVDEDDQRTSSTLDTVKYHLGEAADKSSKAVEEGIQAVSYATKSGIVKAREEYDHLQTRSQVRARVDHQRGRGSSSLRHCTSPLSSNSMCGGCRASWRRATGTTNKRKSRHLPSSEVVPPCASDPVSCRPLLAMKLNSQDVCCLQMVCTLQLSIKQHLWQRWAGLPFWSCQVQRGLKNTTWRQQSFFFEHGAYHMTFPDGAQVAQAHGASCGG